MQHLKNFNWKKFLLQGVLPCLLAVAVGFISRYQLELSDGVTESFLQLQWPLYAPLNALTAFCLTLILFALLGKWSRATGISGAVLTLIALINYYTRDLHGSALMPQDILNLGTAAEVMGSYTLKITQDVVKIVLLYLPILAIVFVQAQLVKGAPKRTGWKARGVRAAGSALGVFLVMFFGYFGPVTIKPKTTYGWAWQNTYYTYGYLAGTIEATSLMADPVIEPENYNDAAAVNTARKADDYTAPASPESAEDYPDIVLILSESFYDFDLVTDLQADTDILPDQPPCGRRHKLHRVRDADLQLADPDAQHHAVQLVEPVQRQQRCQLPQGSGLLHDGRPPLHELQLPPRLRLAGAGL